MLAFAEESVGRPVGFRRYSNRRWMSDGFASVGTAKVYIFVGVIVLCIFK